MTDPHPHAEAKERLEYMSNAPEECWTAAPQEEAVWGVVVRRSDLRALLQENEELRSRATKAEGERDQARDDYIRLIVRIVDIREASGVGAKPMLTELPDAIRERIATLTRELTEAREERIVWHSATFSRTEVVAALDGMRSRIERQQQELRQALAQRDGAVKALGEGSGIYTASKTIHAPIWHEYRSVGAAIKASWIDQILPETDTSGALTPLWDRCVSEARDCAALVLYRRSGEVLRGALVEAGAALAAGRPVFFVGDPDGLGSFLNHRLVSVASNLDEAIERASAASILASQEASTVLDVKGEGTLGVSVADSAGEEPDGSFASDRQCQSEGGA